MTNTIRITFCEFHPLRLAVEDMKKKGKPMWVCEECFDKLYNAPPPNCKYCGIKIVSWEDVRPLSDFQRHLRRCPRRKITRAEYDPTPPEGN